MQASANLINNQLYEELLLLVCIVLAFTEKPCNMLVVVQDLL